MLSMLLSDPRTFIANLRLPPLRNSTNRIVISLRKWTGKPRVFSNSKSNRMNSSKNAHKSKLRKKEFVKRQKSKN